MHGRQGVLESHASRRTIGRRTRRDAPEDDMRLHEPRLAPLEPGEMPEEITKIFGEGPLLNIFRTLAGDRSFKPRFPHHRY